MIRSLHISSIVVILAAVLIISGFFFINVAFAAWYNSTWQYRQKITIDATKVDSTLTDFPVYVDLSDMQSGFFSNTQSDGGDIRVTTSDGTTEVPREVVSINIASSTGELYFKASSISASEDTEFYIYYGNSQVNGYALTDTYGSQNVWTNGYAAVYHLGEDPSNTAPQVTDSSPNNNDGTTEGVMTSSDVVEGQTGKALQFDGNDDAVTTTYNGLGGANDSFTLSIFLKSSDTVTKNNFAINNYVNKSHNGFFAIGTDDQTQGVFFWLRNATESDSVKTSYYTPGFDGTFHGYTGVRNADAGEMSFFIDGALKETNSYPSNVAVRDSDSFLGLIKHNNGSGGSQILAAVMDEVRVSNLARDEGWVNSEHINQTQPTSFYTFSSQEQENVNQTPNTSSGKVKIQNGRIKINNSRVIIGGAEDQ